MKGEKKQQKTPTECFLKGNRQVLEHLDPQSLLGTLTDCPDTQRWKLVSFALFFSMKHQVFRQQHLIHFSILNFSSRILFYVMFIAANTFALMPSDSLNCRIHWQVKSAAGMGIDWQYSPCIQHSIILCQSRVQCSSWTWSYMLNSVSKPVLHLNTEKMELL